MITVSYSVSNNLEGERDIEILALDHSSSSHAKSICISYPYNKRVRTILSSHI